MNEQPKIFQDSWGLRFDSILEMAQYRIENPTLPVGGAQCPALEYTFSGSTDGGQSWEHPTASEMTLLRQGILDSSGCCLNDLQSCPARR